MIARRWIGYAGEHGAEDYRRHVAETVFPGIRQLDGFCQALLLPRETAGEVEFQALTLWRDMAAVGAFCGNDLYRAVVEPRARDALSRHDTRVDYFDVPVFASAAVTGRR